MQHHRFTNDYSEGAHPRILEALMNTNLTQHTGYGMDEHCQKAAELICRECSHIASGADSHPTIRTDLDIHFLVGGTQTNRIVIDAALRPYQAVIAVSTGHINVHETGAVEASGHKVIAVPGEDGKLTASAVEKVLSAHRDEHMVQPKMVYISNTTELGTQYTKKELEELSRLCRLKGLYLTMADLADLTDAFYIGGTKNGALFGEALVIRNDSIKKDFRYMIKQNGAMLAKGWLLGIQFETLFTDGLFYEMAAHANELAQIMRKGFEDCQIPFLSSSASNQLFPIVDDSLAEKLMRLYGANAEKKTDDTHTAIRFVTSWATPREAAQEFVRELKAMV